ncbi:hypothetical protein HO173_004122 [Letharia columbiana]|uniref:Ecp2 effector protein domain-containing protein n=1 Tax=Letharia columbiana TaxID=112416 RepID=A0A8H6G084_9LECA|nr:uncharacterized protein HO173_004122 [Letharia columbiana]KAF6237921.1 hypothetical protein HO173_004122 [Letharia columbiana]
MSSFIFLLLWTVVQCPCAATAPSPSYTIFQDQSSPPSPTLNARNSPICVRVAQNPDWAGAIDAKHCADAIGRLWDRMLPYGYTQWTFWATKFISDAPPGPSWEVPQGSEYGNCVVVFRMAKDLGDDVLPYGGGFEPTSQAPASLDANWPDLMEQLLQLYSFCVQRRKSPAWTQVSDAGVLLMLPKDSVMKQRWSHRSLNLGNASAIISNVTLTS